MAAKGSAGGPPSVGSGVKGATMLSMYVGNASAVAGAAAAKPGGTLQAAIRAQMRILKPRDGQVLDLLLGKPLRPGAARRHGIGAKLLRLLRQFFFGLQVTFHRVGKQGIALVGHAFHVGREPGAVACQVEV